VSIQVGDSFKAKVIKTLPSGVIIQLEGGEHGIVRKRELYWSQSLSYKKPEILIDDELQVIVLNFNSERNFGEFSLKQALGDPWNKVIQGEYKEFQIVSGEVVDYQSYGVFVELEPGIVGLLHKSAVPLRNDQEIHEVLWIQDQVQVLITKIDLIENKIDLSILGFLQIRHEKTTQLDKIQNWQNKQDQEIPSYSHQLIFPKRGSQLVNRKIHRILIIDDDRIFSVGFRKWLKWME
jgi:ribosomal protein S1